MSVVSEDFSKVLDADLGAENENLDENLLSETESALSEADTAGEGACCDSCCTSGESQGENAEESAKQDGIEPRWYVLHTYSGYENMVKDNLEMVFKKNNMQDRLVEITIPIEDVVEEKNGKRKIVQRRMFPCYVLIKMIYDNSMWHMIVQTRGVTGFVGPQGRPIPLSEDEIRRMHLEKVVVSTDFKVGDKVTVNDGPLEGFVGEIESLDALNGKVKVTVSMFGRLTPVDLDLYQITPVEGA